MIYGLGTAWSLLEIIRLWIIITQLETQVGRVDSFVTKAGCHEDYF